MKTKINVQVICIYLLPVVGILALDELKADLNNLLNEATGGKIENSHVENEQYELHVHDHDIHNNDYDDFYDFDAVDIDGNHVSLEEYRGMISLVVNVASECGYTDDHYRSLIRLQNVLGSMKKFTVLAFPCNQFGGQEPGTRKEIKDFTSNMYHVNFPVFDKVNVIAPNSVEPWDYLIKSSGASPSWNFWKYLVDENGKVLNAWGPHVSVDQIFLEVRNAVNRIQPHAYDEL